MKRIAPIHMNFVKADTTEDSERRVKASYSLLFERAWGTLSLDSQSTQEYINTNAGNRRVFDTRGSSRPIEGQKDNGLSDVPSRKNTGSKVWQGMADQQQATYRDVYRERELWSKLRD